MRSVSPDVQARRFRSTSHPSGAGAPLVYARAMIRPLGLCLLPVMLGTLIAALQGDSLRPYLLWGWPAALLAAWAWAHFQLQRTPAELQVRAASNVGQGAVRSVRDVLNGTPLQWQRVLGLRTGASALRVDLGDTSHRLPHERWPEHEALLKALQDARRAPQTSPSEH